MKYTKFNARLVSQLRSESPETAASVKGYIELDKIARKLGLLSTESSLSKGISWMPVISVLGTFSAGKSTFLNSYLGQNLQRTGNQAVDDKFTVIMYSADSESRTLPGSALNSDPRFPMYRIDEALEDIQKGEGERINAYMQLKTTTSSLARGKIFIDSPGFDADEEREAILTLAERVIEVSDLVLVLFDARHPEPGAMRSTLEKLVTNIRARQDSDKFLYILNQIDATAAEDNMEEVFAAWQRALAQAGLTHGRFYRIYDEEAAVPIVDEEVRRRFEAKRAEDMAEIRQRIDQVAVDRAYRIAARLDADTSRVKNELMNTVTQRFRAFRRGVRYFDTATLILGIGAALIWYLQSGVLPGQGRLAWVIAHPYWSTASAIAVVALLFYLRYSWVRFYARRICKVQSHAGLSEPENLMVNRAVHCNTGQWRSVFGSRPKGWRNATHRRLARLSEDTDMLRERLNNRFAKTTDASNNNTDASAS